MSVITRGLEQRPSPEMLAPKSVLQNTVTVFKTARFLLLLLMIIYLFSGVWS